VVVACVDGICFSVTGLCYEAHRQIVSVVQYIRSGRHCLNLPGGRSGELKHSPVVVRSRALHSADCNGLWVSFMGAPTAKFLAAVCWVRPHANNKRTGDGRVGGDGPVVFLRR